MYPSSPATAERLHSLPRRRESRQRKKKRERREGGSTMPEIHPHWTTTPPSSPLRSRSWRRNLSPEPEKKRSRTIHVLYRFWSYLLVTFSATSGRPRPDGDHRREALAPLCRSRSYPAPVEAQRRRKTTAKSQLERKAEPSHYDQTTLKPPSGQLGEPPVASSRPNLALVTNNKPRPSSTIVHIVIN